MFILVHFPYSSSPAAKRVSRGAGFLRTDITGGTTHALRSIVTGKHPQVAPCSCSASYSAFSSRKGIMKHTLLISLIAACATLGGCIIADPYYGGPGRDRHGDRRDDDRGRYENDRGRDHQRGDDRDRDRDRGRDYNHRD
jgi:hypothetical protein